MPRLTTATVATEGPEDDQIVTEDVDDEDSKAQAAVWNTFRHKSNVSSSTLMRDSKYEHIPKLPDTLLTANETVDE